MKKKIMIMFLLFLTSNIITIPLNVEATGTSFSIVPVPPDNQRNKEKAYFDLRMEPGKEQIIEMRVTNALNEEQIIVIDSSAARSNQNGIIEYKSREGKPDNSLIFNFPDIIKVQEEIKVPANSTVTLPIEISLPNQKFDGIILGGLTFQAKDNPSDEAENQITNKFAYSVAVMISQNDTIVLPELNLQSVTVTQSNLRNVVTAFVQNKKAAIAENLEIEAFIYREKQNDPIYYNKEENYRMAPNSSMPFIINTNDKPLKAGNYLLKMTAKSNGQVWEWEKKFIIQSDEADKLNATAVSLESDNMQIYFLSSLLLIIAILVILSIILWRRREIKLGEEKD